MKKKKLSKNKKIIFEILHDEVCGDISNALKKMTKDYTMTWVNAGLHGKQLFHSTGKNLKEEMQEAYPIRGREYEVRNIAEGENVMMVELVESYPDPKTKKIYRTPLVLVLEMRRGKIQTGRHYCDPRLSFRFLLKKEISRVFKKKKQPIMIIK